MMQPKGSRKLALAGLVLAAFTFDAAQAADEAPLMSAIFADHMVLQRDRPIDVWGRAAAGEQVSLAERAASRRTQVAAAWRAVRAMDEVVARSGGNGMRMDNPIQRFWRDAHAGRVHAINDVERALSMFGTFEFGMPIADAML